MAFNPVFAGVGDNKLDVYGATDVAMFTITFGAGDTYVTGGLALTAAQFGLSRPIAGMQTLGGNTANLALGNEWYWNTQTQKLMALGTSAGIAGAAPNVELTNGTSLANFAITVLVYTQR